MGSFVTDTPDLVIENADIDQRFEKYFTGLLRVNYKDGVVIWVHFVGGQWHRELGPAWIKDNGEVGYYLNDQGYTANEYWKIMYKIYEGSENEELCLSQMLAS